MKNAIAKTSSKLLLYVVAVTVLFTGFFGVPYLGEFTVKNAEAVVGRPVTPGSVAGVARRTTRRVHRRHVPHATTVVVLPSHCEEIVKHGTTYFYCDDVWYEPSYEGDTIVYIVVVAP